MFDILYSISFQFVKCTSSERDCSGPVIQDDGTVYVGEGPRIQAADRGGVPRDSHAYACARESNGQGGDEKERSQVSDGRDRDAHAYVCEHDVQGGDDSAAASLSPSIPAVSVSPGKEIKRTPPVAVARANAKGRDGDGDGDGLCEDIKGLFRPDRDRGGQIFWFPWGKCLANER